MINFAFTLALALRYDFDPNRIFFKNFILTLGIVGTTQILTLMSFRLYKSLWKYSSAVDLVRIIKLTFMATCFSTIVLFLVNRLENFPRSTIILNWIILIFFMGGGRLFYRLWEEIKSQKVYAKERENIIIIGAGNAGERLAREIVKNPNLKLKVSAFIDEDPRKKNKLIFQTPIYNGLHNLKKLSSKLQLHTAYIAIPSADSLVIRRIVEACQEAGLKYKILPNMEEMLNKPIVSQLRHVKPEDLLRREPVMLDMTSLKHMIEGNTIIVTGAGGSIGSELCRQICKFKPRRLVLFEFTELFLFNLENELNSLHSDIEIIPIIGDIRDKEKVEYVFSIFNPNMVYHAAAYKHVPLVEHNPQEAIKTNVIGTQTIAEAAIKYNVEKFVLISSDKAVNPTNIMGTTKRISEMICTNLQKISNQTKFVTVRFGNVLGSNGSVIPTFQKQIENGGPITITHKDMTRYFMSIPEASQLVLQSSFIGKGGEIFVLDMGQPVRIVDLAQDIIKLYGLVPDIDIKFEYIGLRPGEKLYEELFADSENIQKTIHPKIQVATHRESLVSNDDILSFAKEIVLNNLKREDASSALKKLVPEFKYSS